VIGFGWTLHDVRSGGAAPEGKEPVIWLDERYSDLRDLRVDNEVGRTPVVSLTQARAGALHREARVRVAADQVSAQRTGKLIRADVQVRQVRQAR